MYLTFVEEVLDDWFRYALGLEPGTLWDYVFARNAIDYRSELTQRDVHAVGRVSVVRIGSTSVTVAITLHGAAGRLAAKAEAVVVAVDADRRPRPVTDAERAAFTAAGG